MADDDLGDIDDLERVFKLLSDEEAEQLARDQQTRVKRARINPGSAIPRSELGAVAYEVVAKIAVLILEDTIKVRTAAQARDVASVFHQIARLESGQSTQNVEMTREDRITKIGELADAAAERAGRTGVALRAIEGGG